MNTNTHLKVVHRSSARTATKSDRPKPFGTAKRSTMRSVAISTNYATMPAAARKAMLADLEAHYRVRMERRPFDPTGLPELALAQCPAHPWIAEALRTCTVHWRQDDRYSYFIDPATHGTAWKFAGTLMLDCPVRGGLVIDLLHGQRIGGIEFLNAVMGRPTSAEKGERPVIVLSPVRRNTR